MNINSTKFDGFLNYLLAFSKLSNNLICDLDSIYLLDKCEKMINLWFKFYFILFPNFFIPISHVNETRNLVPNFLLKKKDIDSTFKTNPQNDI